MKLKGILMIAVAWTFGMSIAAESTVTWRVGGDWWMAEGDFARMCDYFTSRKLTGKIAMFVATGHSPGKLELLKKQIDLLGPRCAALKKLGYSAGVNILCTIGQGKEAVELSAQVPGAQPIVTSTGETSCCRYCPIDPVWREGYIKPLYEALATSGVDFVWIDDDMRLSWNDVPGQGCFCPRCMKLLEDRLGFKGTHKDLDAFFSDEAKGLERRLGMLQLNREKWLDIYAYIEKVTHAANDRVTLGWMDAQNGFDARDFGAIAKVLSPDGRTVFHRPGGGFYRESDGLDAILGKANAIGYMAAMDPANALVESEIELHPKCPLLKSTMITVNEALAYIAAGARGTAWNILPWSRIDRIENDDRRILACEAAKKTADEMMRLAHGENPKGVWDGRTIDYFAGNRRGGKDGSWFDVDWNEKRFGESDLQLAGIPMAYTEKDAVVIAPSPFAIAAWTKAQCEKYLATGLYLSADALEAFIARGYGEDVGFTPGEVLPQETDWLYLDHPFSEGFAGKYRTACATFLKGYGRELKPRPGAVAVASGTLYDKVNAPCIAGVFENKRGGRIYANGYFPYSRMATGIDQRHFRRAFDWLSHERLPGWIDSTARAALWVRGDLAAVFNMSQDDYDGLEIVLRKDGVLKRIKLDKVPSWSVTVKEIFQRP